MTRLIIPDERGFAAAVEDWQNGEIVAFPTETVYGLGADATNDDAVAKIYEAKGRPSINPLIIHAADKETLAAHAEFTPLADELATRFWPGPLTLVLKKKPDSTISANATAGLDTIAVRVPNHPVARRLLKEFGRPVAAPSANPSGQLTSTTPKHITQSFPDQIPTVIIGGRTPHGVESTIIDLSGETPRLLRYGSITPEDLKPVLGDLETLLVTNNPSAPGQLLRHYAPRNALRLNATAPEDDEAYLAFGPYMGAKGKAFKNLSEAGDLHEAASNLFMYLHELDDTDGIDGIAVAPVPELGIGLAINDRLRRGSATE